MMRKLLAAACLLALVSCDAPDPNAPADGAAIKNPPVDTNPSPTTGTGGDAQTDVNGRASTVGPGETK